MDHTELEPTLRKCCRRGDEDDFAEREVLAEDFTQSSFRPRVIDRHEKGDVASKAQAVDKKWTNLTPGWIGDDPVDRLVPREEVAAAFNFAPMHARKVAEERAVTGARLEDDTTGTKMGDKARSKIGRSLDIVIRDVVAVGRKRPTGVSITHNSAGQ